MRRALVLLVLSAALAACGSPGGSASPTGTNGMTGRVQVIATTTVLADLVRNVAGADVAVESLVPKGGEVHTFGPAPSDIRRVAAADLIVGNGLGLDEWLTSLAQDAGAAAPIVELGEDLAGVEYIEGDDDHGHGGGDDDHAVNPHLWMDVSIARQYVTRIAEALAEVDPAGADGYRARSETYNGQLAALDTSLREAFVALPEANRRVVSFHDAFPYFARAYGLEIVGVVVEAPGQDPSAGEVATLIDAIRTSGARAIFAEAQFSDRLARQIADETGATVVNGLYTDSVGDAPQDTYAALMRWDADRILKALGAAS